MCGAKGRVGRSLSSECNDGDNQGKDSYVRIQPPELDAFVLGIADQHEISVDTFLGDEALEQRCRKLHGFTRRATDNDVPGHAPVVIQIRLG